MRLTHWGRSIEGDLIVVVESLLFNPVQFERIREPNGMWVWLQRDYPISTRSPASPAQTAVLDAMVDEHPELSPLSYLFGYERKR
jgi:hypothetical protein